MSTKRRPLPNRATTGRRRLRTWLGAGTLGCAATLAALVAILSIFAGRSGAATANFTPDPGNCGQSYPVGPNVVAVTITAIGGSGQTGADNGESGLLYHGGGNGGEGATVTAQVPVTPGSHLYIFSTLNFGPPGSSGGGQASYVSTENDSCGGPPLVLAAGGGGGGGGDEYGPGGTGGSANQAGNDGGSNEAGAGAGGSPGTQTSGGAGGVAARGGDYTTAGGNGASMAGGLGGGGNDGGNNSGGNGGDGYFGGGGGGGSNDYGGGGGGGGSNYVDPSGSNVTEGLSNAGQSVSITPALYTTNTTLTSPTGSPEADLASNYTATVAPIPNPNGPSGDDGESPQGTVDFSATNGASSIDMGSGSVSGGQASVDYALPGGTWTVTATYSGGGDLATSNGTTSVSVLAGPPVGLSASVGNQSTDLKWHSDAGDAVTGYNVYQGTHLINTSPIAPNGSGLVSYAVSGANDAPGLQNGTEYSFSVTAINPVGESPRSNVAVTPLDFTGMTLSVTPLDDSNVVVADSGSSTGSQLFAGSPPLPIGSSLSTPEGVAVDPNGDVFFADTGNNRVVEVPAGVSQITIASGLHAPSAVAVDAAGDVFIADTGANRVIELPAGGGPDITIASGLDDPEGLAVDAAGDVFIADTGNNCVLEVPAGGAPTITLASGLNLPQGVAVDGDGDVYVANTGADDVLEVPAGATTPVDPATQVVASGLDSPDAVSVDAAGNLFIADTGVGKVLEVPAGGGTPTTFASGLASPEGVAAEPQSQTDSGYDQPVTFKAMVQASVNGPAPSGFVDFTSDGTSIGQAQLSGSYPDTATLTVASLPLVGSVATEHVVAASYVGDGSNTPSSAVQDVVVGELDSIEISPLVATIGLGSSQQFTATASYASGAEQDVTNLVTWSASSSGPTAAVVSSTGLVTATGTADGSQETIEAELPDSFGNPNTSSSIVTESLTSPTSITVTPADATVESGTQEQFTATGHYPNGYSANITSLVNWYSSNNGVITLESDGEFLVASDDGADSATITAFSTSLSNPAQGSTTVSTVPGTPDYITLSSTLPSPAIELGQTAQMTAMATYGDGSTLDVTSLVAWTSSDPSIVSVSSSGLVTGVSSTEDNQAAFVDATFTAPDGTDVGAQSEFTESYDDPLSITVTPADPSMAQGSNLQFTATGTYDNAYTADITRDVLWESGNSAAATVDSDGDVTAQSTGGGQSATIYALSLDGTAVGSANVTVLLGDPTGVAISAPDPSLGLGQTEQVTATATYANGSTADVTDSMSWSSDEPGVASVSSTGVVTGLSIFSSIGPETLINGTFTAPDGSTVEAQNVTITVNENNKPISIAVTPVNSSIAPDGGQQFTAIGTYGAGVTADITSIVDWSSASPLITYDGNGYFASTVTGVGGTATVKATHAGGGVAASVSVTMDSVVSLAGPSSDSTFAGPGYQSGTFAASGGSGAYTFSLEGDPSGITLSSSSPDSATLVGTPTTAQSPVAIFVDVNDTTEPGDEAYIEFQLTVIGQPQTITANSPPTSGLIGAPVALSATGGGSGNPVVFSVDHTSSFGACSTSGVNGTTLSFTGVGSCVVDANQAATTIYAAAPQLQLHISVLHAQVISWNSSPPVGAVVANTYIPSVLKGGSGNPIVLSVDGTTTNSACSVAGGTVAFDHVGTCVVDANEAGGSSYAAASQIQQTIAVGQATQDLTFTSSDSTAGVGGPAYTPTFTLGTSGFPVVLSVDAATTNAGSAYASCSVAGGTVSFEHVGTCVLDADQAGDADYAAASEVQQSFTVAPGTQAITFTTLPPSTVQPGDAFPVAYTGGTSGYYVELSTDPTLDPTFNCLVQSDVVYFESAGTCVIDANQQGDADYAAAPQVQLTFNVRVINTAITSAPFTEPVSDNPTTPVTISLVDGTGKLTTSDSDSALNLGSSSPGGIFAATSGGAPITTADIPQGASSVTVYYADTQAGTPQIGASPDGYIGASGQNETINVGPTAIVSFAQGPVSSVENTSLPLMEVSVTDQFGNPEIGVSVTLSLDHDVIASDASETTDVLGYAYFGGTAIADPGTYTLTASSGGVDSAASNSFDVTPPISVTGVGPSYGDPGGGTTVSVSGSGFTNATEVMFGANPAESYVVDSDTEITATSPPGSSGWVDVTVANVATQSGTSAADQFLYSGGPASIAHVSPARCSILGGCHVVITGYNFTGATAVSFGSTAASSFDVVNFTTIAAVVPAHAAGSVWVRVSTPGGANTNGFYQNYFVFQLPPPQVTHLSPSHCSALGACTVVITGQYLNAATSVSFGTTPATHFQVVNGSTIQAVAPAHAIGAVWVRVTTPIGHNTNGFYDNLFSFRVPPPSISSLSIHSCSPTGGCSLVITGAYFTGATKVTFGKVSALAFVVVNDDEIDVTVPTDTASVAWVRVTTPTGTNTDNFYKNYFVYR